MNILKEPDSYVDFQQMFQRISSFPFSRASNMAASSIAARSLLTLPPPPPLPSKKNQQQQQQKTAATQRRLPFEGER